MDRVFELCSTMLRMLRENNYAELPTYMEQLASANTAAVAAIRAAL